MNIHLPYMERCFQLALAGLGKAAPNPIVGAVLVHNHRIIGEGFHRQYGEAHAEVNAIQSVRSEDRHLIPASTMYVSLEPCAHHGKTPPCADLLIREGIRNVVISNRDPFPDVNGKGIEKLRAAGTAVTTSVLEQQGWWLNRRFFTFHTAHRPYIVLKWAQTSDGFIGQAGSRLLITHAITNRLVHRWRSEEAAVLVGANTAMADNPRLDVRLWAGSSPERIVLDPSLRLPTSLHLFDHSIPLLVINHHQEKKDGVVSYRRADPSRPLPLETARILHEENIQSVLIEGGAHTLQAFIEAGLYDELRILTNTTLVAAHGIPAPGLPNTHLLEEYFLANDQIRVFRKPPPY